MFISERMVTIINQQLNTNLFPALNGIRGIAAIIVVLFHIRSLFLGYENFPGGDGYLAVDIFFSLSGFVLANAYLAKFQSGLTFIEFAKIRIVRLYPLYFLGLIIGIALYAVTQYKKGHLNIATITPIILLQLFTLPAISESDQLFPLNNVAWSLFFELIVNIIFALTWNRLNIRTILAALVFFGTFLGLYIFDNGTANIGNTWSTAFGGFLRSIFSFSLGLLVHNLYSFKKLTFSIDDKKLFTCLIIFIAYTTFPVENNIRAAYDFIFIFIASPAILIIGINHKPGNLTNNIFSFLGAISYAIYCLHYPALQGITYISKKMFIEGNLPINTISAATIGIFLLLGFLADIYYDVPVRRALAGNSTRKTLKST